MTTVSAAAGDRLFEIVWLVIGGMIAFATVGAMIEDRRPGPIVARICLTIGLLLVVRALLILRDPATARDSR